MHSAFGGLPWHILNAFCAVLICGALSQPASAQSSTSSTSVSSMAVSTSSGATASGASSSSTKKKAPATIKLPKPVPTKRRVFLRTSDFQLWAPVYIFGRQGRLREMFEVNPRVSLGGGQMEQLLVRPAVGFQLNNTPWAAVSLWQGYAWTPAWLPRYLSENRTWQQILVESRFKRWGMINRTRLEERYIEPIDRTAMRIRHFLRLQVPIKRDSPWAVAAQEELFINLNKVSTSITPAINQNRVFLGINRRLHPKLNVDVGYQYQWINRNLPTRDRHNHVLMINTYYTI